MSERKGVNKANKDTIQANTLKLYDGAIVIASCVHKSDTKMLSRHKASYKHYILYDFGGEIISLLIKFFEIIGRYKVFKEDKTRNFRFDNDELIEKYEELFKYVSKLMGEKFSAEPVYENAYGVHIKSKIHENKTRFHHN